MVAVGCTGGFAMLLLWFGRDSERSWLGGWTLLPIWMVLFGLLAIWCFWVVVSFGWVVGWWP